MVSLKSKVDGRMRSNLGYDLNQFSNYHKVTFRNRLLDDI